MFGTTPDPWLHWRATQAGQPDASTRATSFGQPQGSQQSFAPQQGSQGFTAAAFATSLGSTSAAPSAGSQNSPTSAFNLLGKNAPPASAVPPQPTRQSPDQLIASALHQALAGEKRAIPSWNGSPSTLRSWLKLLAVWEFESTVPMDKREIKLLQSFQRTHNLVELQILFLLKCCCPLKGMEQFWQQAPHAIDVFVLKGSVRRVNLSVHSLLQSSCRGKRWNPRWARGFQIGCVAAFC